MRICLVHGIHVSDAQESLGAIAEALQSLGHDCQILDYGWVSVTRARVVVDDVLQELLERDPQVTIAHSNGNPIVYEAARQGLKLAAHIAYQPAMRRDTVWPESIGRVLVLHNRHDYAVRLGRIWRWVNPVSWFLPHRWGTAGAKGFSTRDSRVTQWDVASFDAASRGHSYLHRPTVARRWAPRINHWLTK